jgi:hypothetical protein
VNKKPVGWLVVALSAIPCVADSNRTEDGALGTDIVQALQVPEDERTAAADFLELPRTDLFLLLADPKPLEDTGLRGGGSYYSVLRKSHEYGWGSELKLEQGTLRTGFAGLDFGYFLNTATATCCWPSACRRS